MSKLLEDGKYSASAKSFDRNLDVNLVINQGKIQGAKIDLHENDPYYNKVAQILEKEIINNQSSEIDAVSGASVTSRAVRNATYSALKAAQKSNSTKDLLLKDGSFSAKAQGHGGPLTVKVLTKNNQIKDVSLADNNETPDVSDTAMNTVMKDIVDHQTLNVDAITGATMSTQAVITATTRALEQAGNARAWSQKHYSRNSAPAQDLYCDVVIAGAGLGGLSTAMFACKRGLKPILVEKNGQVGGSFKYAAGAFATTGSKELEEIHQSNNFEDLIGYVHKLSEQGIQRKGIDYDLAEHIMQNTGKTFDDLLALADAKPSFFLKLPYTAAGFASGAKITKILENYILNHGGTILTSTVITKVLIENNQATGIQVRNTNGKFIIKAKNVVLATGGASYGKKELLEKTTPSLKNVKVFNEANRGNTGDGYDLLKEIGADFYNDDVYKNAELDFTPALHIDYSNEPDYSKAIVINEKGKRFTNEAPFNFLNLTTALYREGSSRYYLIYDGSIIDPKFKEKLDKISQGPKSFVYATTISELAAKLDLDPMALRETFEDYQAACSSGKDKFGKAKENLVPFNAKNGYYAIYTMPGSWGTIGGVKINKELQVLKKDGLPFNNLFAIGELSTGALFDDYYMIGFSLANYSTEGRLVAESL